MMEKKSLVQSARVEEPNKWDTSLLGFNDTRSQVQGASSVDESNPFADNLFDPDETEQPNILLSRPTQPQPRSPTNSSLPSITPTQTIAATTSTTTANPLKQYRHRQNSPPEDDVVSLKSPQPGQINGKEKTNSTPSLATTPANTEDFFGLFESEDKNKVTTAITPASTTANTNRSKNEDDNVFGFFDDFLQPQQKQPKQPKQQPGETLGSPDQESWSGSEDMNEEEHRQMQNMFGGEGVVLPPPQSARNKSKTKVNPDRTYETEKVPPHMRRRSEPVKSLAKDNSTGITERTVGVNPTKEGVHHRVRADAADVTPQPREKEEEKEKSPSHEQSPTQEKSPTTEQTPKSPSSKKYDCLPELRRGTALLKYGKQGYPHFRQFNLSQNNEELVWFSKKKKLDQSSIRIKSINEVLSGQHTKEFQRISWTTLAPASFSIWYDGHSRSLNLVAKSVDEMKMWVDGLRLLREKACRGEDLSKLRALEVSVDFKDRNRPQSRKHSGNFLRSNETKEKDVDPNVYRQLMDDLKSLGKTFKEVKDLSLNELVQKSHEVVSINQILSELEERIEELKDEVVNTRSTKIAENDVWRTRVDLEALREKISVLIKASNKKPKRRFSVF